jgi:hypothetical protein
MVAVDGRAVCEYGFCACGCAAAGAGAGAGAGCVDGASDRLLG